MMTKGKHMKPTVAILNRSSVASDVEIGAMMPALQMQVTRDFAPIWGCDANLVFCSKNTPAPKGSWQVGIFDNSDVSGALGYHDLTVDGLPFSKVFWGTDLQYNQKPSVTLSHEILEMLADPYIATTVFTQDNTGVILYAMEVGDAVESDDLSYGINGVSVTDFVTPRWFDPMASAAEYTSFRNRDRKSVV
jgi:hypothetical protein